MKTISITILFLLSFSAVASDETAVIDVKFKATKLAEVAEYVNAQCLGKIEPIVVSNPDKRISLNFENMHCASVALVLADFDIGDS